MEKGIHLMLCFIIENLNTVLTIWKQLLTTSSCRKGRPRNLKSYTPYIKGLCQKQNLFIYYCRATENRFFAGSDRFIVCKTDSICIKRIFFGPKKTHFADHILAQFPGLVKCQTVNCPQLFQLSMLSTHY